MFSIDTLLKYPLPALLYLLVTSTMESDDERGLLKLANDMLAQLHVRRRVNSIKDINHAVFVMLYEGLCGEQLPGKISTMQCSRVLARI